MEDGIDVAERNNMDDFREIKAFKFEDKNGIDRYVILINYTDLDYLGGYNTDPDHSCWTVLKCATLDSAYKNIPNYEYEFSNYLGHFSKWVDKKVDTTLHKLIDNALKNVSNESDYPSLVESYSFYHASEFLESQLDNVFEYNHLNIHRNPTLRHLYDIVNIKRKIARFFKRNDVDQFSINEKQVSYLLEELVHHTEYYDPETLNLFKSGF
jgi:hypothetical protein